MKKKTKILSIFIVLLVFIFTVLAYYIITTPTLTLKTNSIILEYGEELNIDINDLITVSDEKILDTISIDLNEVEYINNNNYPSVGSYNIIIEFEIRNKKENKIIKLEVKDTISPIFTTFNEIIEVIINNDIDYSNYFIAEDLSDFEIIINDDLVKYNEVGEHLIEVKAIDEYNNETIKNATIKIINKTNNNNNSSNNNQNIELFYVDGILVVNKKHPLPSNYAPGENNIAGNAIRKMISDMQALGYDIINSYSGYRSYSLQSSLYNNYVSIYGQKEADTFSARPGHSEHQTGLAFDLKHGDGNLVTKEPEATWIANNAHLYGFIVRYQSGKEHITGYMAEPWHLRYIGDKAESIYLSGKTLEEYLGVEGGDYN